jgi:hypothetical protein
MENSAFEEKLVGRFIAAGGEHKVFRYGDDKVIKFPFGPRYWVNPAKYCENLRRDELIVRRYFGAYLVQREIHFYYIGSRPSYVIIEPKLHGRHLLRDDLKIKAVYKQFQEIVEINSEMINQEDLSVEIFGLRGLLLKGRWEASNIMFNPDNNRIFITDAGVMHFGRNQDQQILLSLVTVWAMRRQAKLIKHYFNAQA